MKFLNSKTKSMGMVIAGLSATVLFYQNCAKTNLEKITEEKVLVTPSLDLKSNVCSQARFLDGDSSKFVFIMDLSASNFGSWESSNIGGQNFYYWNTTTGTDSAGDRFKNVKQFLTDCDTQTGNKFAFIGFSRTAGLIGADGNLSCDSVNFTSKENAIVEIDKIMARQIEDEKWYKKWAKPNYLSEEQPDSLIYSVTSYTAASKCLEKLVVDDLTSNNGNTTDRYDVFFISDGLPQDKNGTGCNDLAKYPTTQAQTKCFLDENLGSVAVTRTAAISKGKNLQIQGIYYGNTGGQLPEVLDKMSREGGTTGVLQLANFKQSKALCELVTTQNALDYRPDLYTVINMTVQRKMGILKADSDMDGLTDEEEITLGYDPQNPRSILTSTGVFPLGILDSICHKLGGPNQCQQKRAMITCNSDLYDKLGLSDCDHKVLGLNMVPGVLDVGVDSDRDGMPDFVEIVKGTDPAKADMSMDPDGDGVMNRDEILRGSDPYFSDRDLSADLLNKNQLTFKPASQISTCESGDWELSVQNMLVTKTQQVEVFPNDLAFLRHGKNEQMLLAVYRMTPTNSVSPVVEYYGTYVPVSVVGKAGAETLTATPRRLVPNSFQLLGKANP